jgi:imidazolonepropionase-like amidohydrolase
VRVLFDGCAITDARGPGLQLDQAVLVDDSIVVWMGAAEEAPRDLLGLRVVDATGATLVPGLVDGHSHLTLPGGARWIGHLHDDANGLLAVAEENGVRLVAAGVRWARDVGAPRGEADGRSRALSLAVRDRWHGRRDRPYVRAAGTWITRAGTLTGTIEVADGDGLVAAVDGQLDDGADLIKLYLDGPDRETAPFTSGEVARAATAAHQRGARVTAHATTLHGARAAVLGGVDAIEHGVEIDGDLASTMAERGTFLVTTHSVWESWLTFADTTAIPRFADRPALLDRRERAHTSTRIAHRAGVPIAGGSDFGGGSVRAGHLAWEVVSLVACGLEPWEALAAVTWRGGDLLGEPTAGRVAAGGPPDFFLVHGNPLADPASLWRVWAHG